MKKNIVAKLLIIGLMVAVSFGTVASCSIETMAFQTEEETKRYEELILGYGMSFEEASNHMEKEGWFSGGEVTIIEPGKGSSAKNEPQPPACSHDWASEVTKEPSCAEEGSLTKTCTKCGESKTEVLKKTEHDYTLTETIPGDCKNKGKMVYICDVCGEEHTEESGMGDHIYIKSEDSAEPTCTDGSTITMVCAVCGDSYTEEMEALGHDFPADKSVLEMPTCVKDGKTAFQCRRCGALEEEEILTAYGHRPSTHTKLEEDATFWKDGEKYYFCTECKEKLDVVPIPAGVNNAKKALFPACITTAVIAAIVVVIKKLRKKK